MRPLGLGGCSCELPSVEEGYVRFLGSIVPKLADFEVRVAPEIVDDIERAFDGAIAAYERNGQFPYLFLSEGTNLGTIPSLYSPLATLLWQYSWL
jgi:hypothetical protein